MGGFFFLTVIAERTSDEVKYTKSIQCRRHGFKRERASSVGVGGALAVCFHFCLISARNNWIFPPTP